MATGMQSLPTKSGDVMFRRIAVGSILIGIVAGIWIWQRRPSLRPAPRQPSTQQPTMQAMTPPPESDSEGADRGFGMNRGFSPSPARPFIAGALIPGGGQRQRRPQAIPRYFANLATQAGPFVVSIRQVLDYYGRVDLYNNLTPLTQRPPFRRGGVSLQIMCSDPARIKQVDEFASRLVYTDDLGQKYEGEGVWPVQDFERGLARIVELPEISPETRYLKRIEGEIVLKPASSAAKGRGRRLPFRIENVPLPVENHIFGVAAATYLPSEYDSLTERAEPHADMLLLRDSQARQVNTLLPPFRPEPNPLKVPDRLLLQPDRDNRFRVYLPGGTQALTCTLKPVIRQDGEFRSVCRIAASSEGTQALEASFSIWDNEPVVLLFSERALFPRSPGNRRMALRLHLYLHLPSDWLPATSPFPAEPKERGASLTGQVLVRDEPVRRGFARLAIQRVDGGAHSGKGEVETELFLDEEGRFRMTNFSPGYYRVEVVSVTPYRSFMTTTSSSQSHLSRRYAFKKPVIAEARRDNLLLRGGAEIVLPPFRVQESAEP